MKKTILILLAMAIVGGAAYYLYDQQSASQQPEEPLEGAFDDTVEIVSATAVVVPVRWAQLSFKATGQLAELLAEEGDAVESGEVLARLDRTSLERAADSARAALEVVEANLAQVRAGPRGEEIVSAEAAVALAEAELARTRRGPDPEDIRVPQGALEEAEAALRLAQAEYDKISWIEGLGMTPQALELERATVQHEIAKANYEAVLRGPTQEDITIAEAAVEQAKAQAAVVRAGPSDETIAVAEAQVAEARVALDRARAALADAELTAPFSGTAADVLVREGEWVMAGTPALLLGNLSPLRIETTDLSELDIALVKPGQKVEITFDALPHTKLYGEVAHIAPKSSEEQGGTNYKVTVALDEQSPELRWGMTAFVDITVAE